MSTDGPPRWSTRTHEVPGVPGTRLLTAVIDERTAPNDATFVVVQGIRSWIEEFELQRFQLVATTLTARLVVVEVPGFGVAGSRLLRDERRALLRGDFGPLAERMFGAVSAVLDETVDRAVSFIGYSMGTSIATAMARVASADGWTIENLVLVEPVALQRWKARHLLAATRREDRFLSESIAANRAVVGAVAPWDQRPGVRPPNRRYGDLVLLGGALRCGGLANDLGSGVEPRRVVVVRGDRSALSAVDWAPVLAAMRRRGIAADEVIVPGHHAFWHSLPAVADMTRRVADLLTTP
jgi:pimeloyl-ACP methyl ester carboxylesterase